MQVHEQAIINQENNNAGEEFFKNFLSGILVTAHCTCLLFITYQERLFLLFFCPLSTVCHQYR
jgi:hypothetical protein